ncbi:MAG: VanW family protein [Candidatus Moraniibacteriota bacterium]
MFAIIFKANPGRWKKSVFFVLITIIAIFLFVPCLWGKNRVLPRTYLGNVKITGTTEKAGEQIIKNSLIYEQKPILIIFQDKKINTTLKNIGLTIDQEKTNINFINTSGSGSSSFTFSFHWWENLFWGYKIPVFYTINMDQLESMVGQKFDTVLTPVQEASLKMENDNINLTPAREGVGVDSMMIVAKILKNLRDWGGNEIEVKLRKVNPDISNEEANNMQQELENLLSYPFAFKALDSTFHLARSTLLSWVEIQKVQNQEGVATETDEDINVIVNTVLTGQSYSESKKGYHLEWNTKNEEIAKYLDQEVQGQIYRKPVNGTLAFSGGSIQEVSLSQSEVTTDMDKAVPMVAQSFRNKEHFINLPVKENPAAVSMAKVKELGIDTLVGKGESDFTGSPNNRKHNIRVGASKFNGAVVGQDEEFSFLKTLGPVDKSTGYLPELVIKQDKTVPEFGGGMCQVSTTCFRAEVNSGLRTTERQNHAYPVQYYSPQGTDATVYIPHPDLKFVNDTPGPILIQTIIVGNKLSFEFYGKSDGRRIELEGPRTWDKKSDGSMKAEWIQRVYDKDGKLMFQKNFLSKYDSPSKFPHPGDEKPPTDKKKKKKHGGT